MPPAAAADGPVAAGTGEGALPCDVSKALAANCQNCHGVKPGGGVPMSLVTYGDLVKPAHSDPTKKVYEVVQLRIHDDKRPMPPNADMAVTDKSAIDGWVQGGAKSVLVSEAAACATPPPPTTTGSGQERNFTTGKLIPTAEETCYELKVHGSTTSVDDSKFMVADGEFYEQFYYSVPWPANTVATAYGTLADNGAVLHHWLLFSTNELQQEGNHIQSPLPTLIGADPILLAGWAVGGPNVVAPDGVGMEMPDPGRTINVQWHFYNSTGTPQADGSALQICTVPKASRKNIANVTWLGTENLNGNVWTGGAGMPPHMQSTFSGTCTPGRAGMAADQNIHIFGFEPHMHRIGKRMQTAVKRLDGTMETIFDQPFSFGSETHYAADFELKPGEQLVTNCSFDNDNDFGVPFGESTDSEMCYQFTWAYPAHSLSNRPFSFIGVPDACW